MRFVVHVFAVAFVLSLCGIASAQSDDELFNEDSAPAKPSPSMDSSPADTRAPAESQLPRVTAPPKSEDLSPPSGEEESSDDSLTGFELGLNISGSNKIYDGDTGEEGWTWGSGGSPKVALQPGWNFGRFGIYMLLSMNYMKTSEKALTAPDKQFGDYKNPGGGTQNSDNWAEQVDITTGIFTYDIGVGARFYLLKALALKSTNLYLELDLGWRGAAVSSDMSWKYTGDPDMIPDNDQDGHNDADDVRLETYDRNQRWKKDAEDFAEAIAQRYDGFWLNLGLGGEYVFAGGFGVGGEVGLQLFYNSEWTDKSPFGSDAEGDVDQVRWVYSAKWTGTGTEFGLYYALALRYHF